MNCADFHTSILQPAHAFLATIDAGMATDAAAVQLLAIAGQESGWSARQQVGGPARGFWQFEPNGVLALLQNVSTQRFVFRAARTQGVGIDRASLYLAIEHNDPLAYTLARLLLWADPAALPAPGDEDAAWALYERCWRPGKPSRERWAEVYPQAVACVGITSEPAGAGEQES